MKNYRVVVHFKDMKDYTIEAASADAAEEEAVRRFRQVALTSMTMTVDWVENASEIASSTKSSGPLLKEALIDCLRSMEMQEQREAGDFHISQPNALAIWNKSKELARVALLLDNLGTCVDGKPHDDRGTAKCVNPKTGFPFLSATCSRCNGEHGRHPETCACKSCQVLRADATNSPRCEVCGASVREGLRACEGLSPCWREVAARDNAKRNS